MKNTSVSLFLMSFLSFLAGFIGAAASEEAEGGEGSYGVIIYSEGSEAAIYRKGEYVTYDLTTTDMAGLPVFSGDMIQTDKGTILEIQLYPTQSIVKLAENTTFSIKNIEASGGAGFDLAYGRVRAKVGKLTGRDSFQIRGRNAVAGVRGTDFGFDFAAEREEKGLAVTTKVYCFEGAVEVSKPLPPSEGIPKEAKPDRPAEIDAQREPVKEAPVPEPLVLSANEMVSVKVESEAEEGKQAPAALPEEKAGQPWEKAAIAPAIVSYWEKNDFMAPVVPPEEMEKAFPGLKDRVENRSLKPDDLKKVRPKPISERAPKDSAPAAPKLEETKPREEPEKKPAEPVKPESPGEWLRRLSDQQKRNFRIGSIGVIAVGLLTAGTGALIGFGGEMFSDPPVKTNFGAGIGFMLAGGLFVFSGSWVYATVSDSP